MATTEALTENPRQGINSEIPPCFGLDTWLSLSARPGCGHAYNETPVGLVVYVRNDPVNSIDPDGRDVCTPDGEGGYYCRPGIWVEPPPPGIGTGGDDGHRCWGGKCGGGGLGEQQRIAAAVSSGKNALTNKEDCRKLLQGKYEGDVAGLLATIQERGQIRKYTSGSMTFGTKDANGNVSVTIAATLGAGGANSIIGINDFGPFFNPTNTFLRTSSGIQAFDYLSFFNRAHGADLNEDQFREVIILHELGHATGAFGPDANNPEDSMDNTKAVIKDCIG
jgi:hypothetical protein